MHTSQGPGGEIEEFYLEDPASPSRATATASAMGPTPTVAGVSPPAATASPGTSKASPGIILKEKLCIAKNRNALLARRCELIALEAKLAILDMENERLEEEYQSSLDAITRRRRSSRPEVEESHDALQQNGTQNINKDDLMGSHVHNSSFSHLVQVIDSYTNQYGIVHRVSHQIPPGGGAGLNRSQFTT